MKRLLVALVLFLAAPVAAEEIEIKGEVAQGGFAIVRAEPGTRAIFEGREMRISADGRFPIAFGRDAGRNATLELIFPDGRRVRRALDVKPRKFDIQRIDGLPEAMVTPDPVLLERIRAENARIAEARRIDGAEPFYLQGFVWPATGRISGIYGSQRILNGQARQPHYGIDIAVPTGTPVVAVADAVVTFADPDIYFTGGTLILDHGSGVSSTYSHLSRIDVTVGQRVRQGEAVAASGATGRATGPHLDWRLNLFDIRIDPILVLPPLPAASR
ncbi:MAG: M23 family metallopeptidase [Proteobacteria bacterium]|nr:M23 family metallopeptidase [Pseudomonadota bacterium]